MHGFHPIDTYLPALYVSDETINIKNMLNTILRKVIKNEKAKKSMISFLGILFYAQKVYAIDGGLNGVNNLGFKILNICRGLGYWVCIIMCINDIVKTAISGGEAKDIGKVIVKYLLVFGSLYLVPTLFDEVPNAFN